MKILEWAKSNPWEAGGGLFVIGLIVLWVLGAFKTQAPATSNDGSAAAEAYFAAQSQQAVAGDELQAVQVQAQAATAQTQITTQGTTDVNNTWATENLATTQNNNATSLALAPYQVQADLISGLTSVASVPGAVTTQTWGGSQGSASGGIFGLGSGSQGSSWSGSSQQYYANQGAETAAAELAALGASTGMNASH